MPAPGERSLCLRPPGQCELMSLARRGEASDASSGQSWVSPGSGHNMQSLTALILLGVSFDKTRAQAQTLNITDIGRAFTTLPDLTPFGVDLESTFDSLLSPAGIVDQFSLSIVIQLIFVVGYVTSGEQIFKI